MNRNPSKFNSSKRYMPQQNREKIGWNLLGQKSKACQIGSHGACLGYSHRRHKCKCECHEQH